MAGNTASRRIWYAKSQSGVVSSSDPAFPCNEIINKMIKEFYYNQYTHKHAILPRYGIVTLSCL